MFNLYIEPYGYDRLEEGVVEENMKDMAEVDQSNVDGWRM